MENFPVVEDGLHYTNERHQSLNLCQFDRDQVTILISDINDYLQLLIGCTEI